MKIEQCNIGQDVVMGKDGIEGKIIGIWPDQVRVAVVGGIRYISPDSIDPVSDPCQSCEMAATITGQCKQIADLQQLLAEFQESRDNWKATAQQYCCNAAYWRGELEKLQQEALAEYRPLGDVAKIYVQVSPAVLAQIIAEREE